MIEEKTKKNNIYLFKRVSIKDKYNFYEYLSIMLDSGISLSEALKSSSEKMKNQYFKEKIKELIIFISS
jgi:type II secretory pathway component PulF